MAEEKYTKTNKTGYRRQQKDSDLSVYTFGKVQPQALPLEEAVLGAIMLDKDALPVVLDILRGDSFYSDGHKAIYKAMLRLFEKSQPVDLLTVTEALRKSGELEMVGGPHYLVELTNRVASAANIEYHARIISQKHIQRELIRVSTKVIKDAFEDTTDVFELLDEAEQGLFSITEQNLNRSFDTMSSLTTQVLKNIEELSQKEEGLTGVPTGFVDLDRLTSGWQPSDLIIVAARPGMGKTAYTLALTKNAAMDFGKGVAFFSLEMASVQLVQRLISMEAEIPAQKMRNGQLEDYEWQQLQSAIEKMSDVPIFIDDTPGINIFELRAKCRRLKMQHDIQMVVIDYLQLMSGGPDSGKGNREQEISNISRGLKGLAKELSVPVIALSQLSRAVETRGGMKRPQLSDLRECVTGDTLIYVADTGAYHRVDELVDQAPFSILAMDDNYKLRRAKCVEVWATGEKEVYEVETSSGHKIRTSLNHPFYTPSGWQQLVDIKTGDFVSVARKLPDNQKENQTLQDGELIFLAHMIGDGCYVERQPIHYTSQEKASIQIMGELAQELWGIQSRIVPDQNSSSCQHIYFPSPYHLTHHVHHPFVNLLHRIGLPKSRSHGKEIPSVLFECSNRQIGLFIHHLWSTDGGVFIRNSRSSSKLHYSSNSRTLLRDLKSLLLRFGIDSTIKKTVKKGGYRPTYQLSITGSIAIQLFASHIGIFGSKAIILQKLIKQFESTIPNPNRDVIPKYFWNHIKTKRKEIWNHIKTKRKEKGFTSRTFQAAINTNYCGSTLYKSNMSRKRLTKIAQVLEDQELRNLAESGIRWEKIKSITHLGAEMTYDLHVEGLHNFVANNFIVHNSGAIEQDADIVSFIYRPEYYQILEDEEGNSLKGVAEIIVAKHRNGALKTVKLKFIDHFAKFANLEDPDFSALDDDSGISSEPNIITRSSRMNDDDIPF